MPDSTPEMVKINENLRNQVSDTEVGARTNYKVNAETAEYDDVVARYTNPDGTKKAGWLKAPNGKKSNLTERQWVQVRTPAFKQWFGDWERSFSTTTESEAREHIRAWRDSRREFRNIDSGRVAELKSDWGKIFSSKAKGQSASYESHYVAAAHLDVLFESGIKYAEENPRNGSPDVKGYAKYLSAFSFGGETYVAKITVKEYPDAKKLKDGVYSVEAIVVEKIDTGGNNVTTAYLNGQSLDPDVKGKITNLINSVNSVSKVVDENGEPMVVYHGSKWNPIAEADGKAVFGLHGEDGGAGFYFTANRDYTSHFGGLLTPVFINARNGLDKGEAFQRYKGHGGNPRRETIQKMSNAGFDFWFTPEFHEIAVFSPTQIKSATDNVGTFDGGNPDIRYKVNVFTGAAADYAQRLEDGTIVNGPSLHYVGTGEGAQIYGWGLYGSDRFGVAKGYADRDAEKKAQTVIFKGKPLRILYYRPATAHDYGKVQFEIPSDATTEEAELIGELNASDGDIDRLIEHLESQIRVQKMREKLEVALFGQDFTQKKAEVSNARIAEAETRLQRAKELFTKQPAAPHLYEQTFFTNRPEGDESHLLKWFKTATAEQLKWLEEAGATREVYTSGPFNGTTAYLKGNDVLIHFDSNLRLSQGVIYAILAEALGSPKAATEWLVAKGIDGVKYPVNASSGGDGSDGWNYVSFRDDNIRVVHKWRDGKMLYKMNRAISDSNAPYGVRVATLGSALRNGAYDALVNYYAVVPKELVAVAS